MNKWLLIIALGGFHAGCAGQAPASRTDGVLLGFSELAQEITVGVEATDAPAKATPPADAPLGTP